MGHDALYKAFPTSLNDGVIQHLLKTLAVAKGRVNQLSLLTSMKTEQGDMSKEKYGWGCSLKLLC